MAEPGRGHVARAGTFGGACREASGPPKPKDENLKEAKNNSEVREICVVKNTASHNKDANCKLRAHLVTKTISGNRTYFPTSDRRTNEHARDGFITGEIDQVAKV